MIETSLFDVMAQYGLLGVMFMFMAFAVRYMAKRDEARDERLSSVVENNTVAITRFLDQTKNCQFKGGRD